jgi:hypothetical protein
MQSSIITLLLFIFAYGINGADVIDGEYCFETGSGLLYVIHTNFVQ